MKVIRQNFRWGMAILGVLMTSILSVSGLKQTGIQQASAEEVKGALASGEGTPCSSCRGNGP